MIRDSSVNETPVFSPSRNRVVSSDLNMRKDEGPRTTARAQESDMSWSRRLERKSRLGAAILVCGLVGYMSVSDPTMLISKLNSSTQFATKAPTYQPFGFNDHSGGKTYPDIFEVVPKSPPHDSTEEPSFDFDEYEVVDSADETTPTDVPALLTSLPPSPLASTDSSLDFDEYEVGSADETTATGVPTLLASFPPSPLSSKDPSLDDDEYEAVDSPDDAAAETHVLTSRPSSTLTSSSPSVSPSLPAHLPPNKATKANHRSTGCSQRTPEFEQRFKHTCAPWISRFNKWKRGVARNRHAKPVAYACLEERLCHGIGDRISGIFTALDYAMLRKRPLRVLWDGLDTVFRPSCEMAPMSWHASKNEVEGLTEGCMIPRDPTRTLQHCQLWHGNCKSPHQAVRFGNAIRTCWSPGICREMESSLKFLDTVSETYKVDSTFFPGGTTAHLFGCPMRLLLEPQPSFLYHTLSFLFNGEVREMSVSDIANVMKEYYVISMHFRLGDKAFMTSDGDPFHVNAEWERFRPFFDCAEIIDKYTQAAELTHNKPIRWLFASDSPTLRDAVRMRYGDRLMMVSETPSHISKNHKFGNAKSVALQRTFAEWYVLSLGDTVLLNRFLKGPTLYQGRLSGFAKTLWAYQLKHLYYDAGTCRLRTMSVDGSWRPKTKHCVNHADILESVNPRLPQPHLDMFHFEPPKEYIEPDENDGSEEDYNGEEVDTIDSGEDAADDDDDDDDVAAAIDKGEGDPAADANSATADDDDDDDE